MSISILWAETRTEALPTGGDREVMEFSRLVLDIVEQDTYDVVTAISTHAAEEGVPFSDHARPEQDRVTVTVNVSGRQSSTALVEDATLGVIELQSGREVRGIIVPEGTDRIGDCFETLRTLARESVEVDVDGLRRPIEGWLIDRVSSPRTVDTAGMLVCEIGLVEVRYAEVEDVAAPSPRVERGRRQADQGRQPTEGTDNPGTASSSPSQRTSAYVRLGQALSLLDASGGGQ